MGQQVEGNARGDEMSFGDAGLSVHGTSNYICPAAMDEEAQTLGKITRKPCQREKAIAQGWRPEEYQHARGKQRKRRLKWNRQQEVRKHETKRWSGGHLNQGY